MYEEKARLYESDFERAKVIIAKTEQTLESLAGTLNDVSLEIISGVSGYGEDLKLSQNRLESISKVRQDIAYSLGAIQAGDFQATLYADFFKGYAEDLTKLDGFLVYFQDVLTTSAIRKDSRRRLEYEDKVSKNAELIHSLAQRKISSLVRLGAIVTEAGIEQDEQHKKTRLLHLKLTFTFIGLAYVSLFLLLVIWKWHKFNSKKSSKLANTLEGILESTERFADYSKNRKLWGASSVLFGVCFWFVLSTINSVPDEVARIERFHARIKLTIVDGARLSIFWAKFDDLNVRQNQVFKILIESIQSLEAEQGDARGAVLMSVSALSMLRYEISKQIGTIKGMTFQSPSFANYFGHIEENLRQYDEMLSGSQKVLHSYAEGDITKGQALEEFNNPKYALIPLTLSESSRSAQAKLLSAVKVMEIEEREYEAHKKATILRVIGIIPATFYMLAFSFVALHGWIKFRHTTGLGLTKWRVRGRKTETGTTPVKRGKGSSNTKEK
jgi:hypothetical protein